MEYLITAGQLVTGPGGRRLRDGAVLVRGATIAGVGPRAEIAPLAGPGATVMSFPDGTLLPGLIDCHVHLALDAGPDPVTALLDTDDTGLLAGMAERARQLLDSGVTTVRDLGDRGGLALRLRNSIEREAAPGPRILSAGTPLTRPGGHCWFFGGEVGDEESLRDLVRRNVRDGVDVIKVMATGGGITKGGPPVWQAQFTAADLDLVVAEARRAGLPVAAHAHGTEGIAAAVAAGVDTIEHCTWMARDGFDVREDLVAEIAAKGIRVCPAASPDWRGFARRFGQERAEEMFDRLRWMAGQGVRLIAGTDAGVAHAVFDGFVSSLEFFRHIGFSPAEAIDAATVEAALALGIASDTGRLTPGYRADLIAVTGDPLADLAALRDVRLTMSAGRPHVPSGAPAPAPR